MDSLREACEAVADSHAVREAYIQSWPQAIPKDIVYECLNAYHRGTQQRAPPVCRICSRQHHPGSQSLTMRFNRPDGPVLDLNGIQVAPF